MAKNKNRPSKRKKPKRQPRPLRHRLHFDDGVIWTWEMRRDDCIIRDPEGQQFRTDRSELTGATWDEIERSDWKRCGGQYGITPGIVKQYIQTHLKGMKEDAGST